MVRIKRTEEEKRAIRKRRDERRRQERGREEGFTIGIGEEPTSVKKKKPKPTTPTAEPEVIKLGEEPRVGRQEDDSILLNLPEKEKEIPKPSVFNIFPTAKAEGRLHAGEVPIGISGAAFAGGFLAEKIKVSANTIGKIRTGLQNKAIVGKLVELGRRATPAAANFATNAKTAGLTSSFVAKAGMSLPVAGALLTIIGSYPFAGFIKEEALQTLSFGTKVAMDSGDLEGAQAAIDQVNEILNPSAWDKILASVPFANVVKQLRDFYLAAATKNANDQEALDKARKVQSGEQESDFAKSRRISDEAARERELGFRAEDEAFFQGIREETEQREREREEEETEKFQRIAEEREARDEEERIAEEEESARFEEIRERNKQEDLENLRFKARYFDLIREGRFDEAAQLLAEQ